MKNNIYNLHKCKLIEFPTLSDERGDLTFLESFKQIPFDIKRIYYLHNNKNLNRGAHAHKELNQIVLSISGSFDIKLDDGKLSKTFKLSKKNMGLYICPMIWRDLFNFTKDSVCLVLASDFYKESDYIRNYQEFLSYCE